MWKELWPDCFRAALNDKCEKNGVDRLTKYLTVCLRHYKYRDDHIMEDDTEGATATHTHAHTQTHTYQKDKKCIQTCVGKILGKGYSEDLGYSERYYKPTLQGDV
jgi:hypothetical protein